MSEPMKTVFPPELLPLAAMRNGSLRVFLERSVVLIPRFVAFDLYVEKNIVWR